PETNHQVWDAYREGDGEVAEADQRKEIVEASLAVPQARQQAHDPSRHDRLAEGHRHEDERLVGVVPLGGDAVHEAVRAGIPLPGLSKRGARDIDGAPPTGPHSGGTSASLTLLCGGS